MMVIKVQFTDDEITEFFKQNGFVTATATRGKWISGYHNQATWHEIDVPGVMVNGKVMDAEPIFQQVVEARTKRLIAPQNLETQRTIERIIKQIK